MKNQISFFLLLIYPFILAQRRRCNLSIFKLSNNLAYIAGLLLILASCSNKYSKREHVSTIQIGQHLYNEVYKVYSGGVFASDSYSNYITDSANFRKYVGTRYHDDEELYCSMIDSNTVLVVKRSKENPTDTLEINIYEINKLIIEGKFE